MRENVYLEICLEVCGGKMMVGVWINNLWRERVREKRKGKREGGKDGRWERGGKRGRERVRDEVNVVNF